MVEKVAQQESINWPATKALTDTLTAWTEGKRRMLMEGGTSSSKTWSALQFLAMMAELSKTPLLISIVSESLPHLKRGCIHDFFKIMGESTDNNPYWSKTEYTYKRPNWKGVIEFFGADNEARARGPRRDVLYLNEPNNISSEVGRALDVRTTKFTIADWNPVSQFWVHEFWMGEPENAFGHYTYLDALNVLPPEVVKNIESYKDKDPNWWNVYGLGLLGKIEGLVYPKFEQIDVLPVGEYFYGLDYGFASDPTVGVKNVIIGDKLYSQQMFWDTSGLTNDQIGRKLTLVGVKNEPIFPDPDEPKSAEELRQLGFNVQQSVKGAGSVAFGIQRVNQFYQYWTKDSLDCIKGQRNHRYLKNRETGQYKEETTHQWSHGLDARRYAVASFKQSLNFRMKAVSYL